MCCYPEAVVEEEMCSTANHLASLLGGQEVSQAERSRRKLEELSLAVSRAERKEDAMKNMTKEKEENNEEMKNSSSWTECYKYWSEWEDVEELRGQVKQEESRLESLVEHEMNPMGHCHSHSEERKMFELPEKEKMEFCERHRLLGNYLYREGIVPKAAEQYKLALSFYDYCFPEDISEQHHLDELRHAAQCNISLCYRHMGYFNEALDMANQAIRDSKNQSHISDASEGKAYFRRAEAHHCLDNYDLADEDLRSALRYLPEDVAIKREMKAVQKSRKEYLERSKEFSKNVLGAKNTVSPNVPSKSSELHKKMDALQAPLSCLNINMPLEPRYPISRNVSS